MRFFIHLFILTVILASSCQMSRKDYIKGIVKEWQGKEILIPEDEMVVKFLGRDTLCVDLWSKPYKIFTYIDSIGCTSCQLNFDPWKELIALCQIQQLDVSFLFVIHSSNFENFDDEVRFFEFDYPLIYDYKNSFDKINNFPPSPYRTFLLDKDNKIQVIGSPTNNSRIWELYKKVISQQQ